MGNEKPVRRQSAVDWYVEYCRDDLNPSLVKASDYDALAQRERKLRDALEEVRAWFLLNGHDMQPIYRRVVLALRSSDHIEGEK